MQQTMMAILALVVVSMLVLSHQSRIVHGRVKVIQNEIAMIATGVAVDRLEEIGVLAFDQATRDTTATSVGALTPRGNFRFDLMGDDIDDLDGVAIDTVRIVNGHPIRFGVMTNVFYADESDPDKVAYGATTRTKFKKVVVKVISHEATADMIRLPDTIRVSRSFSCGSRCAW